LELPRTDKRSRNLLHLAAQSESLLRPTRSAPQPQVLPRANHPARLLNKRAGALRRNDDNKLCFASLR
jgi:hypothetical protein